MNVLFSAFSFVVFLAIEFQRHQLNDSFMEDGIETQIEPTTPHEKEAAPFCLHSEIYTLERFKNCQEFDGMFFHYVSTILANRSENIRMEEMALIVGEINKKNVELGEPIDDPLIKASYNFEEEKKIQEEVLKSLGALSLLYENKMLFHYKAGQTTGTLTEEDSKISVTNTTKHYTAFRNWFSNFVQKSKLTQEERETLVLRLINKESNQGQSSR